MRCEQSGWRRWCARILVASSALVVACLHTAQADEPASKQLRFVVNVAAGSSIDSRARIIAHALGERLKQQVIVDNRPGAGGTIGAAYVAKAPPDGTTLLFTNDSIAINPQVYRDPGYDLTKDFVPVTQAYVSAMVLVAGPAAKIGSVRELVAQARNDPGMMTYGSSGNGSLPHLAMESFNRAAGIHLVHIPYKGDSQALTDIMSGRVNVMVSGIPAALPQIRAGSLRALGVTTAERVPALAEVPTIAEAGVPGYDTFAWTGFFVPVGTPRAIIEKLNRDLVASLQSEAVKTNLEATGGRVMVSTPEAFAQFVQKELARYAVLARQLKLKLD